MWYLKLCVCLTITINFENSSFKGKCKHWTVDWTMEWGASYLFPTVPSHPMKAPCTAADWLAI